MRELGRENVTVDLIRFSGRHVATTPRGPCDTDEAIVNLVNHGRRRRAALAGRRGVEHVSRWTTLETQRRVIPGRHRWREERVLLRLTGGRRHEWRSAQIAP